jgi:Phosphopantetheine attachment site
MPDPSGSYPKGITRMTTSDSSTLPSLDSVLAQLCAVSGAESIDADTPLLQLADVDSLDLMEWLYSFQEAHPGVPADESLFEDVDDDTTMRVVYETLLSRASASSS